MVLMAWRSGSKIAMSFLLAQVALSQGIGPVHPQTAPDASKFVQPPILPSRKWRDPVIRGAGVQCWTVSPSEPATPVGGVHGAQHITVFVPLRRIGEPWQVDSTFQQTEVPSLAGGGALPVLTAADIPKGLFISVKAHPIFRVTKVKYPVTSPPLTEPGKSGVLLSADFSAEPEMGECYFFVAVWVAVPNPQDQARP
jgi:hypothetical protein